MDVTYVLLIIPLFTSICRSCVRCDPSGEENSNNANFQNGGGPHLSLETLQRLFSASNTITGGTEYRFPDGTLGLSISSSSSLARIPPSFPNRFSSRSNAPYNFQANEEDNPPVNLELSLSLIQSPSVTQSQGAMRSSASNASNRTVAPGHVMEEQDVHSGISSNTRLLPIKRPFRELLVGESSSMGAQAALAKRTSAASSEASQIPTIPSHDNLEILESTNPQSFVRADRYSNNYTGENDTPPFSGSLENTATNSSQQLVLHGSSRIDNMSTGNAPLEIREPHSQTGTEVMAPLYGQRNVQGPQFGREIWSNGIENSPFEGTANLLGNFPNSSHQTGPFITAARNFRVPYVPPRMLRRFDSDEPMQILSGYLDENGLVRNSRTIVIPGPSTEGPSGSSSSRSSQEMNLAAVANNSGTENQPGSIMMPVTQVSSNSIPGVLTPERRRRISAQVRSIMDQLRSGRTLVFEELMVLDYSLVLRSFEPQTIIQRSIQNNRRVKEGLSIEEIMLLIRRENFKFPVEEPPENKEACCICQEDYAEGEEIGRLDCVHRFHLECIKHWLVRKNVCPICKRKALAADNGSNEDANN
ncbi:hypothetical protein VNO77_25270 [Canavalia gladiata]|uniref:RING-type E3 ubiquitin transferase n=1 Tax=Canavalia gladiata TaxID=3824 RepID=A0AAN9LB72_CANGL